MRNPLEKPLSLALVLAALLVLSPFQTQEAIIVFGQGHFLACYYYQYKYRKMDRGYLLRYLASLVLVFGGYLLYPNLYLLVTAASAYFVIHLSMDEHFLWKDEPSLQRGLGFLPFVLIYMGMIVDSIFVGHVRIETGFTAPMEFPVSILGVWITPYCIAAAAVALLAYLGYVWIKSSRIETHDTYFLVGAALLATLYFTNHVPNHYYLMGAIILFHYSSWYATYYFRWKDNPPLRNRYLLDMVVINAVVIGLYVFYRLMPQALNVEYIPSQIFPFKTQTHGNILAYLFSPGFFYLWTFMHYLSTLRLSDLGYFRSRTASLAAIG